MKERPILFSSEMVRAILDGRKTQTRRVVHFKPLHEGLNFAWTGMESGHYFTDHPEDGWVLRARRGDGCWEDKTQRIYCPYGQPSDRLWVRETWADCEPVRYRADLDWAMWKDTDQVWKPSIFMPRWASRITLEIASVRVDRVQEISEDDAFAEGIDISGDGLGDPTGEYRRLWDIINAKRGYPWESNPWVWVIEFRKMKMETEITTQIPPYDDYLASMLEGNEADYPRNCIHCGSDYLDGYCWKSPDGSHHGG